MATNKALLSLCDRAPELTAKQMLEDLVPPREFDLATFATYKPDENHPSQAIAVKACSNLDTAKGVFSKKTASPGVYLDGGFGVGKTHLLVSVYKQFKGPKLFGSFLTFTSLIGALGFAESLKLFSKYKLICIDEFELDDPGNTMIMSRLLNELSASGTTFAATSNTPPNALGDGRFAAADFQREILGIGNAFQIIRIDGEDYRHRPFDDEHRSFDKPDLLQWLQPEASSLDDFDELLKHLASLHPAKYAKLLSGIARVGITSSHVLQDEFDALRFVAFVDRAYEAQVQVRAQGLPLTEVFPEKFLNGGYRKKYLRAISRLGSLVG
jgi:cell division protein ZapE